MEIVHRYTEAGIRNIVALRGDPPQGNARFTPHPEGFAHSVELIETLAATGRFRIQVGAYPNRHPDAASETADIDWLKAKIDAGAHEAITQFFFEPETFLRFRDRCAAAGISAPIIPGILPIVSWEGTKRFAQRCATPIPPDLDAAFATAIRDGHQKTLALVHCTELCSTLLDEGVERLHFYTLNTPELTHDICAALGVGAHLGLKATA